MRIGLNTAKLATQLEGGGFHRVVIPVYIPHQEGYFARSLEVLGLCLESLRRTAGDLVSVTVVSNGSAPAVVDELQRRSREGQIDQLVLNVSNRGKVDAALAAARGSFEPLVTVTDCDVLFRAGWVGAVEGLFRAFPECGFVTPFPNPKLAWYHTSATVLGARARGELGFEKRVPDCDLDRFAVSIGQPDLFTAKDRGEQMVVRRGDALACVGGGHFVFSTRREVLAAMPAGPSLQAIDGKSEELWLDEPPDRAGFWRLSTPRAVAYHMGNVPEPWMYEEIESTQIASEGEAAVRQLPTVRTPLSSRLPWKVRRGLSRICRKQLERRRSCNGRSSLSRSTTPTT
jgi:hypothetical protein